MEALQKGGLNPTFVFQKLFCFEVNGVSTFQGTKIGVIKQINTNYAPFSIGVHCMVHRCNLAFKTLSTLGIVSSIEDLLQSCHAYFAHSPKKHLEFTKLISMMETKWFKMLKNVETRWISLIDLLKIILAKYMPLLAKWLWIAQATKLPRYLASTFFSMSIDLNFVCLWFFFFPSFLIRKVGCTCKLI
jgi:hypothetical protein